MNSDNIKILLDKYYEGQTTTSEEQALKAYFSGDNIADELRHHASFFRCLIFEKEKKAPENLDDKLQAIFVEQPFYRNRFFIFYASGIAAGLLLMMVFFLTLKNETVQPSQQLTDAQRKEVLLAFDQTLAALTFVSHNLSKGTAPLEKIEKLESGQVALKQLRRFDNELQQISFNMQPFSTQIENLNQLSKFNIFTNN